MTKKKLIDITLLNHTAGKSTTDNMVSVFRGLQYGGLKIGLQKPHRLAMFLAQVTHESGGFVYDREIWGPTKAQAGYDTRVDLGNTPERDGDGKKYMGRTSMQITGRYNTSKFYQWCREHFPGLMVPDFLYDPDRMNDDPWEGLGPIWYWDKGKPVSLNMPADKGDFEGVTRLVNGGVNGLKDRYRYYGRAALILLGYKPEDLKSYQRTKGLQPDGVCGEMTTMYLHQDLLRMPELAFNASEQGSENTLDKNNSLLDIILSFFKLFLGGK